MPAGSRLAGVQDALPGLSAGDDPEWFKRAVFYEVLVRGFADSGGDGSGDLQGLIEQAGLPQLARHRLPVAAPVLPVAAARRRLRHRRLRRRAAGVRHRRGLPPAAGRGARARHAGDRRLRHEPHLRPAPVVPGLPVRPERPVRRLLRLGRRRLRLPGRADHLHRHRDLQLELRPGPQAVLLAPVLRPPAGPELRQPRGAGGDPRRAEVLAGARHRRLPAGRGALPVRAGGHQLREPARDARVPQADPGRGGQGLPGPGAAVRGEPVAAGRGRTTSATRSRATSARWPSTSRSCRGSSWRSGASSATRSRRSWRPPRRSRPTASGASSCATTTS